ncbi:MAG: pyridoxal-phosphate dependent enzyme [Gemmatimonadaceae bacterium]|nr:pyridoxal-phosphate dependent enzyme [Chitinophagaceae bacterium]
MNILLTADPDLSAACIQTVPPAVYGGADIIWDVLRLDLIHPIVSGNKWFKLKYYLQLAIEKQCTGIVTFGGAYSNHIHATAYAAAKASLRSKGYIRGEKPQQISPTLLDAMEYGMELEFLSRADYSQRSEKELTDLIKEQNPHSFLIPEGGAGSEGIRGAAEIATLHDLSSYTHIACAWGTGTMLKGIAGAVSPDQQIIGIVVLKGIRESPENRNTTLIHDFHFNGYARKNEVLLKFMEEFYEKTSIPTDFVYTGKLMFGINELLKNNYFPTNSKVLAIHSGGLQGNRSLPLIFATRK